VKSLKTVRRELLLNPKTRAAYDELGAEFVFARELIAARTQARLSQDEVARRMGTTQSVVARLESGRRLPSIRTMLRFAEAVGGYLVFKIAM
jgi:DNA-binding transcriptional regulator YiaG